MKKNTRKQAAPSKKTEAETKQPESMDPAAREQATPQAPQRRARDAYALTTLVKEVTALFPEVTYEASGANEFGVNLVVAFDANETPDLHPLMLLIQTDERVRGVDRDSIEGYSVVEFHSSFRTQDSRAPFNLAEAHAILAEDGDLALNESDDFVAVPRSES